MGTAPEDLATERIARACREIASRDLVVGSAGNISVRVGGMMAITRTGLDFATATAADVCLVDSAGRVAGGAGHPSSELEIHRLCGDTERSPAVVHTHSIHATALSAVGGELPPIHYYIGLLGGPVRVAPYAPFGTERLARLAQEAMGDRDAVLLANHGAVVRAGDLDAAVGRAVLLEWLCQLYQCACSMGTPSLLTRDQLADVRARRAETRALVSGPVANGPAGRGPVASGSGSSR